ncbi:MAG: caspase family protein [Hyphomonadaceae bacterium]|nr:caspase family protein [Hyphomonadaceae bacterium]
MRWVAFVLAAVLVMAAGMGSAQTPSSAPPVKLALVIGNADYDGGGIDVTPQGIAESTAGGYVPDLRNPINDASDIRDALTRIGFKVDFVTDADGPTMSAALATFGTKVAEAPDTAQVVIYYAGHAMQVDGVNYLIPARARLPQVDFSRMPSRQGYSVIESVTVPIQRVVDQFREPRAPGVNLLILDACRDNPWDSRVRGLTRNTSPNAGGLAQVAAPLRTIVSFSTALNRRAQDGGDRDRNSPFAAALKDAIGRSGTIVEMLDFVGTSVEAATLGRQSPWYQSASVGRVCLATCISIAPRLDHFSLTPEMRELSRKAREAASKAQEFAARGREIVARSEDGAARARARARGTAIVPWGRGGTATSEYAGDWPNGYGVITQLNGGAVTGDRGAVQVCDQVLCGVGVRQYDPNAPAGMLRYEGQSGNGAALGVMYWREGTYSGEFMNGSKHGFGVLAMRIETIEGEFRNDALNGYAIIWNADGSLKSAGLYANNRLIQ